MLPGPRGGLLSSSPVGPARQTGAGGRPAPHSSAGRGGGWLWAWRRAEASGPAGRRARRPRARAAALAAAAAAAALLAAGALVALGTAAARRRSAEGLRHLSAEFAGPVASPYGVAGGFWRLDLNYSTPAAPPALARPRFRLGNASCWELAAAHPEPMAAEYAPPRRPPTDLPGGVPRAIWRWAGRIPRRLFDSVPFILRESDVAGGCVHCTFVLRYKVLGGQLYTDMGRRRRALDGQEEEVEVVEELLLAALHAYEVPDVDFLLHLGDGCPPGLPLVQANINRSNERAGFTLPKFMWRDALGPQQFQVLRECLQARYPPLAGREPRAVWRGSNTDARVALTDERNVLHLLRTRLHLFGLWYPDVIDAHFTSFPQQAFDTNCVEELLPPGPPLPLEDFNRFMLLLDIDGNAWSDRYRLLAHFGSPVLKQASNLTAFFEHLAAPGVVVEHYAPDLSDLPARAAALLGELQRAPGRLLRMAERQQGLAAYALSQAALVHAAAYTLAQVARLIDWTPRAEAAYELVPFAKCCPHAKQLPAAFAEAVRARGAALGQQHQAG